VRRRLSGYVAAVPTPEPAAPAELVVLLADDGSPIGTADKATVHTDRTPLHLAFSCYGFDRTDRLLVTRRAPGKRTFPGVWTNTCCGHPAPDEPVPDALRRRLDYELGLTPDELTLVLPDFRYRASMAGIEEHELCPVFLCRVDAQPWPRAAEVAAIRWQRWPDYVESVRSSSTEFSPWTREQVTALERTNAVPSFLRNTR